MAGLQNHFISRKRQLKLHQALGFAFKVVKLLEEFFGVARFEVVLTLLDFVLMENVAIGQRMFLTETVLPLGVDQVEHVVTVLQVHRQTFQTVGNFTRDRLAFQTTHLLEVRKLRHFHTVHPDFPTQTPGAERRVFPVIFHEADVVDGRVDPQARRLPRYKSTIFTGDGFNTT